MEVCFVNEGDCEGFFARDAGDLFGKKLVQRGDASDARLSAITVFGFGGLGEIDYSRELSGASYKLEDFAITSKQLDCVLLSGCYTETYSARRKSVAVADKGKILGVTDCLYSSDKQCRAGTGGRIYDTSGGKIGVLVEEDLYFTENLKFLSVNGCDAAICVFGQIDDFVPVLLARAQAYLYGITVCLCAHGYSAVCSHKGELTFASPKKISRVSVATDRQYHIIEIRRRGLFKEVKPTY